MKIYQTDSVHKLCLLSMMNVFRGKYLIKIVVIVLTILLLAFLQRNNSFKLRGKMNHLEQETLRKDSYYNIADKLVLINKNEIIFTEKYRQRMKEKSRHPLHSYLPFKERYKNIESFCSYWENQFNGSNTLDISGRRLLFVDKFKLLACNIPKASSTTITEIFMRMDQGLSDYERPRGPTGVKVNISISNNHVEDIENINSKRVQTYTKILLTRHPFSLIGSKYHFKVTNTAEDKFQREICPEIIKKLYLKGLPTEEDSFIRNREDEYAHLTDAEFNEKLIQIRRLRAGPGNYNITMLEYIRTIVNKQNEEVSPSGQTLMCNPCAVRYDVILHHSNVNEEANLVLDYIQRNLPYDKRVHYMANSPLVSQERCNEEFSRIPMEMRKKLYEFFKLDFLLFGYHFEDNPKNLNACF